MLKNISQISDGLIDMEPISFIKPFDEETLALEMFQTMLPALESDSDVLVQTLDCFTTAYEELGGIVNTLESAQSFDRDFLSMSYKAACLALQPLGMSLESFSMEDNGSSSAARLKETLKKIWSALIRTIARAWDFLKKAFSETYSRHRLALRDINAARIVQSKQRSMLQVKPTVETTAAMSVLGEEKNDAIAFPDNYSKLSAHVNDFLTIRKFLMEGYSAKLSAALKSVMHVTNGSIDIVNEGKLNEIRSATHRAMENFNFAAITRSVPGMRVTTDGEEARVPLTGGYSLQVRSAKLPTVDSDEFIPAIRKMTVDIGYRSYEPTQGSMTALSQTEITSLLNIAEALVRDIGNGKMKERTDRIESGVDALKAFIDRSIKALEAVPNDSLDASVRELSRKVFNDMTTLTSAFTAWGGPVFLKLETLSLRVAVAIIRVAQTNLANFE